LPQQARVPSVRTAHAKPVPALTDTKVPARVDLKLVSRLEFGSGSVAMQYEPRR
jgi:hypothetical protein